MAETDIGERLAGLEAEFKGFRNEILKDNAYIRDKLDQIASSLAEKVDRSYCLDRHNRLDEKIGELERNGKYTKLAEKVEELEKKTPAVIQTIVTALTTGMVMAVISYLIGRLP